MGFLQQRDKDIDFMASRRYFLGASFVLLALSVFSFFSPGPNFGTDFRGGTEVEVAFGDGIDASAVRAAVQKIGFASPQVVKVDSPSNAHQFLIRVKEITSLTEQQKTSLTKALCVRPEDGELKDPACPEELQTDEIKFSPGGDKVSVRYLKSPCGPRVGDIQCPARPDISAQLDDKVKGIALRVGNNNPVVQNPRTHRVAFLFKSKGDQIMDGLRAELGETAVPSSALRVEWIGPKAGKQLRDSAITSIVLAIIFIMLYIAFRFDMRFAPGAILALLHDVLLAVGAMILTQREITLSTVAAMLTIVGYSVNDTVVVYDRIRENLGKYRKMSFPSIINRSLTEMLGRTIRTSGLTAAAIAPFLFWGTGVIRDFAFTLLIGVVVGTYSSIYVAAPLTELIDKRIFGKTVKKKRRLRGRKVKKADVDTKAASDAAEASSPEASSPEAGAPV